LCPNIQKIPLRFGRDAVQRTEIARLRRVACNAVGNELQEVAALCVG
jgi:hypothetical protein